MTSVLSEANAGAIVNMPTAQEMNILCMNLYPIVFVNDLLVCGRLNGQADVHLLHRLWQMQESEEQLHATTLTERFVQKRKYHPAPRERPLRGDHFGTADACSWPSSA